MSTTNMNFISILISTLTRRSLDPLVYLSVYLRDEEKYIQQQKAMSRQFSMTYINMSHIISLNHTSLQNLHDPLF